jgi:cell division protein FtsB
MKSRALLLKRLLPYLKNRYVLTFLGALIWLSFFDRNDFITTWSYHCRLQSLRKEKSYYEDQIKKYSDDLNNLLTNRQTLEKYGREKYFMKRDNEDVFVIINETN